MRWGVSRVSSHRTRYRCTMRAALFFFVLALTACGEMRAPAPHERPAARRALVFNAASETARNFTGDVTLDGPRLRFTKGATLVTHLLSRREPAEPIAQGGPSFAAAA